MLVILSIIFTVIITVTSMSFNSTFYIKSLSFLLFTSYFNKSFGSNNSNNHDRHPSNDWEAILVICFASFLCFTVPCAALCAAFTSRRLAEQQANALTDSNINNNHNNYENNLNNNTNDNGNNMNNIMNALSQHRYYLDSYSDDRYHTISRARFHLKDDIYCDDNLNTCTLSHALQRLEDKNIQNNIDNTGKYIQKSVVLSILSSMKPFLLKHDDNNNSHCNYNSNNSGNSSSINWKIILKVNRVQSLRPGIFRYQWKNNNSIESELIELKVSYDDNYTLTPITKPITATTTANYDNNHSITINDNKSKFDNYTAMNILSNKLFYTTDSNTGYEHASHDMHNDPALEIYIIMNIDINSNGNDCDTSSAILNVTNSHSLFQYPSTTNSTQAPVLPHESSLLVSKDRKMEKEKDSLRYGCIQLGMILQIGKLVAAAVGTQVFVKHPPSDIFINERVTAISTTDSNKNSCIDQIITSAMDNEGFNEVGIITINAIK